MLILIYLITVVLMYLLLRHVHKLDPLSVNLFDVIIMLIPLINLTLIYIFNEYIKPDLVTSVKIKNKLFLVRDDQN